MWVKSINKRNTIMHVYRQFIKSKKVQLFDIWKLGLQLTWGISGGGGGECSVSTADNEDISEINFVSSKFYTHVILNL